MTRTAWLPALVLLLAVGAVAERPMEERLLRAIHTGVLQDVEAKEVVAFALATETSFTGHVLARSALHVVGADHGFPDWPLEKLLERALTLLNNRTHAFAGIPGIPEHFEGEEVVFAAVYALVVSGEQRKAVEVLKRQVRLGSPHSRSVALQALRNIGSAEANSVIQEFAQRGDDRNLAENLLADLHYPFWSEIAKRWPLIPPAERDRRHLHELAAEGCSERSSLAVYLLGFFAPAKGPAQESGEHALFRHFAQRRSPGCFHSRFFAARALALRSPETIEFWVDLFRHEPDAWQRAQLVGIGFGRFGRAFLAPALELLRSEPVQYVQWELMHGNIEVREGARFRDYWDIWFPVGLQLRLNFPVFDQQRRMSHEDLKELLAWLERYRPLHDWVRNHMLYGLAEHVAGETTRPFLRIFNSLPDRNQHWWILWNVADPQALPLFRYYLTLPAPKDQLQQLTSTIERLEDPDQGRRALPQRRCCQPTADCLLCHVRAGLARPDAPIASEAEARAWLDSQHPAEPAITLEFLDPLKRVATAQIAGQPEQRWEFLYGCWRRTDAADSPWKAPAQPQCRVLVGPNVTSGVAGPSAVISDAQQLQRLRDLIEDLPEAEKVDEPPFGSYVIEAQGEGCGLPEHLRVYRGVVFIPGSTQDRYYQDRKGLEGFLSGLDFTWPEPEKPFPLPRD